MEESDLRWNMQILFLKIFEEIFPEQNILSFMESFLKKDFLKNIDTFFWKKPRNMEIGYPTRKSIF